MNKSFVVSEMPIYDYYDFLNPRDLFFPSNSIFEASFDDGIVIFAQVPISFISQHNIENDIIL